MKVSGSGKGTPVILRHDQLGGGKSDRITDSTMFTCARIMLKRPLKKLA